MTSWNGVKENKNSISESEEQRRLSSISLHPFHLQRKDQDCQVDHRRRRRLSRLLRALRLRPGLFFNKFYWRPLQKNSTIFQNLWKKWSSVLECSRQKMVVEIVHSSTQSSEHRVRACVSRHCKKLNRLWILTLVKS